jgi:peptidoglycan/xylan/chitin deacetylase (PgdA/CDA1 family)
MTAADFARVIAAVVDLGFESVTYDELAAWWAGSGVLPERPVMIDLDHPVSSMRHEVYEILSRRGLRPTLFVNTGMLDNPDVDPRFEGTELMSWAEVGELARAGWCIGAHTVTHPDLSDLAVQDPSGALVAKELDDNLASLEAHIGVRARDFAFTGTSWSSVAEREVKKRFRFGRLWIIGSLYSADGREIRYADLAGVPGLDEPDGGPPIAARYITRESDPYRLPSMDLQALIWETGALRAYLEASLGRHRTTGTGSAHERPAIVDNEAPTSR